MEQNILNSKFSTLKLNHKFSKLKTDKKKNKAVFQSLLFPVKLFNLAKVKAWAKKHKYKSKKIKVPKNGSFIHLRLKEPGRFNVFKTILLSDGVKARIAVNSNSKFIGQIMLKGISKFSESIKSETDIQLPMKVELKILCEGPNRDGIVTREDLEESLKRWEDVPIIDFHDKSKEPTVHKMSDRKGYTFGKPYLKPKDGKMWIFVPGEIINRDIAYQAYIKSKRGKPFEISAEYGWSKYLMDGKTYQTNINPHMISLVDKGHIKGNEMIIAS